MSKAKVAIMINSLHFGGAERVMADLSLFLDKNGYEVHFFLMDDTNPAYDYAGETHKISVYYKAGSFLCTLLTLQHFIMTRRLKKKLKIDYTISAMEFMNFVNVLTPAGDKMIPTMHNYRFECEVNPTAKDRFIERVFMRKTPGVFAIVTVAEAIREKVLRLYDVPPGKVKTIYNDADFDMISRRANEPVDERINTFITEETFAGMGRLVPQKAFAKLIRAFAMTAQKRENARLLIIGDGYERETLEKLTASLGISEKVLFSGFLSNPFAVIAKCAAFVLSSEYEGFGNVTIEAMACGLPVIASDCLCGPREIISPGTQYSPIDVELCEYGILTKKHAGGDGEDGAIEIHKAMELLLNDKELARKYKEKSLERAKDFTPDKVYEKWLEIIGG